MFNKTPKYIIDEPEIQEQIFNQVLDSEYWGLDN
jgi:hypothetical protein